MKKVFLTFSLAIISSICLLAQSTSNNSSFEIFSEDGYNFVVLVNGIQQNSIPKPNVKVKSLVSNRYTVKVKFQDEKLNDLQKAIGLMPDIHATLKIKTNRKGKLKLVYQSEVAVSQAPVSTNEVEYTLTPVITETIVEETVPSTVTTTSTTSTTIVSNTPTEDVSVNINVGGVNLNTSVNLTGMDVTTQETSYTETTTTSTSSATNSNNNNVSNSNDTYAVDCSVSSSNFLEIKEVVEDGISDKEILTAAKQATKNKCLSTSQIIKLGNIIISEDDRLNWVTYAYELTNDKDNWYKVGSKLFISVTHKEKCGALNN
jgi:hypothetical protein